MRGSSPRMTEAIVSKRTRRLRYPVAEYEFGRAERRAERHHREQRGRIVLGDDDVDALDLDRAAGGAVEPDLLGATELAPCDLGRHHLSFTLRRRHSPRRHPPIPRAARERYGDSRFTRCAETVPNQVVHSFNSGFA